MGGFFLLCRRPGDNRARELQRLRQAFAEIGFAAPEIVDDDDYVLAAYPKFQARAPELQRYPNGDFVLACGTCCSERGVGLPAAITLYDRADPAQPPDDDVMGHYAVVIKKGPSTTVLFDRFGAYHVFFNRAAGIICSSFYAISSALTSLTPTRQGAYEYVFNGVISGNETLFREVALAPIQARIAVGRGSFEVHRPALSVPRLSANEPRSTSIKHSIGLLDRYFARVVRAFGDRVGSALSGGYDSRLIVACLRRHGANPKLYVYGNEASNDVRLARLIAGQEGFDLAVIDKEARPIVPPAEFPEVARRNFLAGDGYVYDGVFNNGAEIDESARRVADNTIAFNGGGGEIFRNYFYLTDRPYRVRELLWTFYSQFDPIVGTALFDLEEYYQNLERKVQEVVGTRDGWLARPTVEWLYHNFRCRAWDGKPDSTANRFGHTAMPFLERQITEHASVLPLRWKNHGTYEAGLIERIDSRLAAYPSNYGHSFGEPPPLSRQFHDYATYFRPPWLRRYTHRIKYRVRRPPAWGGYLAAAYREAVLPGGPEVVGRLFRLDHVGHAEQYARILSLEYALRQFGSLVRTEF